MKTIAHQIYPRQFQQVERIVATIQNNDLPLARQMLEHCMTDLHAILELAERLQMELFLKALQVRLDDSLSVSNLYLVPDQGQQIRMFNLMAEKFPVVRKAQEIANGLLLDAVPGVEEFVLLDIGMGTGQQAEQMLRLAHARKLPLRRVVLIGIEPSRESLQTAEARFHQLARELDLELSVIGLHKTAEQMSLSDWERIRQAGLERPLLVNASFALHHTRQESRDSLFVYLRALLPEVFVMIEPYGDYLTEDLGARFRHAWHHYGLTFRAIDTIDASPEEINEVKRIFFGRELPDVMAAQDRVEQYETAEMWIERVKAVGFAPFDIAPPPGGDFNPLIQLAARPDYLGFTVNNHPIVAVIGAR